MIVPRHIGMASIKFLHIMSQMARSSPKKLPNKKNMNFGFSLQISSETFLILRIIQRDIILYVYKCYVKYPLFSSYFNDFSRNTQISNFTKIRPVKAAFFHADGQKDTTKLIIAFFFAILQTHQKIITESLVTKHSTFHTIFSEFPRDETFDSGTI